MRSAALIADPAGDADGKIHLQISQQLLSGAGEAMRHCVREGLAMLAQNRDEISVRIALVQEHWFADSRGQLELAMEGFLLGRAWREITIVVEPAFADGNDLRESRELRQLR